MWLPVTGPAKLVYLLGADEWDEADVPADAFVVYQGHHGDKGAARAGEPGGGGVFCKGAGQLSVTWA